jgi:hypothetical protein
MITDMMNVRDLVEKASVADLPREMTGLAAERGWSSRSAP